MNCLQNLSRLVNPSSFSILSLYPNRIESNRIYENEIPAFSRFSVLPFETPVTRHRKNLPLSLVCYTPFSFFFSSLFLSHTLFFQFSIQGFVNNSRQYPTMALKVSITILFFLLSSILMMVLLLLESCFCRPFNLL